MCEFVACKFRLYGVLDMGSRELPKSVVSDSAASRKSLVGMALSLLASTGTSAKDLCKVSNQVPPDGKVLLDGTAMIGVGSEQWLVYMGFCGEMQAQLYEASLRAFALADLWIYVWQDVLHFYNILSSSCTCIICFHLILLSST